MAFAHRSTVSEARTPLLVLVVLAILAATIVETAAAAELGASPELADYFFTTLVLVIPIVGWSWAGSRASKRAGWLALTSGVLAALTWGIHASVVWMVAHDVHGPIARVIAWPAFWLPVVVFLPLVYCVPLAGDGATMAPWLRILGAGAAVGVALAAVAQGVSPDTIDGNYNGLVAVTNPVGIEQLATLTSSATSIGIVAVTIFAVAGLLDGVRRARIGGDQADGLMPVLGVVGAAAGFLLLLVAAAVLWTEAGFAALWGIAVVILIALMVGAAIRASAQSSRARRAERRNRAAATVRAAERRNLRRDLHDGVGPALAAIGIQLDLLAETPTNDPEVKSSIEAARTAVDSARAELRNIVDGLRPPLLDELGFLPALEARCAAFDGGEEGFRVRISANGELDDVPDAVAVATIAVCGEATANAARHSNGTSCEIRIDRTQDRLSTEVEDDGHWRDGPQGHGLTTMRERIEELGGTFEITTSNGGTTVSFSVELI